MLRNLKMVEERLAKLEQEQRNTNPQLHYTPPNSTYVASLNTIDLTQNSTSYSPNSPSMPSQTYSTPQIQQQRITPPRTGQPVFYQPNSAPVMSRNPQTATSVPQKQPTPPRTGQVYQNQANAALSKPTTIPKLPQTQGNPIQPEPVKKTINGSADYPELRGIDKSMQQLIMREILDSSPGVSWDSIG